MVNCGFGEIGPRKPGDEATGWTEPQRIWRPSPYVASGSTIALG
jgi:hypothetical protein